MEQNQPRIPPSQAYSSDRNLARQPYPLDDAESPAPPPDDANVVPIKSRLDSIAEDILTPRAATKRKSAGKGRTATAKQKSSKNLRHVPIPAQHPYADELSQLEAQAERINQILSARAHQKAHADQQIAEQSQAIGDLPAQSEVQAQPLSVPPPQQISPLDGWQLPAPSLEWQATEDLRSLRQREPAIATGSDRPSNAGNPVWGDEHPKSSQPPDVANRSSSRLRRLRGWRFLELPRHPLDRIGDAALWIVGFAIVRIGARSLLAAFPLLSPVFLALMLAPAALALYLAFCVPNVGRVPIYRLFLITVGLFVGGKL